MAYPQERSRILRLEGSEGWQPRGSTWVYPTELDPIDPALVEAAWWYPRSSSPGLPCRRPITERFGGALRLPPPSPSCRGGGVLLEVRAQAVTLAIHGAKGARLSLRLSP